MNKGAAISPKKKDDKCFQYALTMSLNYNEILKKDLEKVLRIKCEDIDFPSHQKYWKKLNKTINQLLLMSYLYHKIVKK